MLPYISIPFEYLSPKVGNSPDELKLVFTFIISYPLSVVLKRIPDSKPHLKSLFTIGVSLFYLVGLFDLWYGLRTLAISAYGIYAVASLVDGPFMPWIGFVFVMVHMSINQLDRQWRADPGSIDVTGAQMVMVMKLSAFCWNVADGRLPDKDLTDAQKERSLKRLPSLLDFTAWVLFFPAFMTGPAFDYVDYRRWLDGTMFDLPAGTDPSKKPPTRKKRKIPRSGTPAAWKAVSGFAWMFAFVKLSSWYNPEALLSPKSMEYSLGYRVWLLYMLGVATRTKYYAVWSLSEGACILTGLGYNGVDPATGKISWDKLQNINPWGVETAQNTRAYLGNWNMNTNNWLRNYIYLRVTPKGKKPGFRASMATFVTSAIWHGFYPGYYMTFILASFVQTVAKNFRRYFRPFFLNPQTQKPTAYKVYYDIFSYLTTQVAFCFVTGPFVILTFSDSWLLWGRVYYYAIIGTAASMAFFASPAKPWLKARLAERSESAGALKRSSSNDSLDGKAQEPVMGLAPDSDGLDEAIKEIRAEMEARQRQGMHRSTTI